MPVPNDNNLYGLNVGEGIGMGLLDKSNINGDKYYDANSGKTYSIDSKGNLWGGIYNIEMPEEEEEYDETEQSAIDAYSGSGEKGKLGNWMKENKSSIAGGLSMAGGIADQLTNNSFKGNQAAFANGAFSGRNEIYDTAKGFNSTIAATDFNQANAQYQNMNKQLNQLKTKQLSGGTVGGMVGTGALKGAALGMQVAGPWGGLIGGVVGAGVGGLKAASTNNKISDANLALKQKGLQVNNYMNRAMMDIKSQQMKRAKQDYWNNSTYNRAYGGNLYADGGALQDPYGINYFDNGKKHEQNKYGGVPVSIAEDGKPNLVEEGEVLYDDYVYSNRIKINDTTRRRLKLKDSVKTFADAAKEVKERGIDRPNDPITEHTIKAHMQILKSEQEQKKQKQQEKEQQKMIAQMNEQQLQAMQEQQMNQQADAYEQQMAQQQQMQQPDMQAQQGQMMAEGGKLKGGSNDIDAHRFADEDEVVEMGDINPEVFDWRSVNLDDLYNADKYDYTNKKNGEFSYGVNEADELPDAYLNTFDYDEEGNPIMVDGKHQYTQGYTDFLNKIEQLPEEERKAFYDKYDEFYKHYHGGKSLGEYSDDNFKKMLDYSRDNKWGNSHMFMNAMRGAYEGSPEEEIAEDVQQGEGRRKSNWMEYAPLGIDAYLAARSFAPVDYSRMNAIMNTPIRDIQYKPVGGKIAPYIIDPRLQYQMNAEMGAATNRAIQNNAGGNSASAIAAMLANNNAINQSAANLGYQADSLNAKEIQDAQEFNNSIDQTNSQGFLQAAAQNQEADNVRGNYRYYGLMGKENIDASRGQAISNSMGALATDVNNLNKYLYDKNWNAALAGAGYYGNLTPEGMRLAGITYQNTPQAQLDREAQIRMAEMQSEDNLRAIESQERIAQSQLAQQAAQEAAWRQQFENEYE